MIVVCLVCRSGGEGGRLKNKDASYKVPHNIL
jgi:hypothetical protein